MPTALLWLRHDLRVHDHGPLADAVEAAGEPAPAEAGGRLLAVYCLDPRQTEPTDLGVRKMEAYRAEFVLESLRDLRRRMRELGGDLVVRRGRPEDVLPDLARQSGAASVHLTFEPTREETDVADAVRQSLPGLDWRERWGHTLVDVEALPFAIDRAPDVFTQFRKAVERAPAASRYPAPRPAPPSLPPPPPGVEPGDIPDSVEALGLTPRQPDTRHGLHIRGGETEGLARLQAYVWDLDRLKTYKETRNGMLDPDDSSKLSPWLSNGCLSPRRVQAEVARYEAERVANKSTYWLTFELLWRDFFRVYGARHGDRLFWPSGPKGVQGVSTRLDHAHYHAWCDGRTGLPLVDASMRELNATGFMSNRGRQNAASFFVKHLDLDWRAGAAYYEGMLVDYDVTSNWGNWAYVAGVGATRATAISTSSSRPRSTTPAPTLSATGCPSWPACRPAGARALPDVADGAGAARRAHWRGLPGADRRLRPRHAVAPPAVSARPRRPKVPGARRPQASALASRHTDPASDWRAPRYSAGVPGQQLADGLEQEGRRVPLAQERRRPGLLRVAADSVVRLASQDQDGQRGPPLADPLQQVEPAHARQPDVGHDQVARGPRSASPARPRPSRTGRTGRSPPRRRAG